MKGKFYEFCVPQNLQRSGEAGYFRLGGNNPRLRLYAPAVVFIEVFKRRGVEITMEQARRPMGLKKVDHIRAISQQDEVAALWKQVNGKACSEADVQDMFEKDFVPLQVACIADYSELIPGIVEVVEGLKKRGIIIGSTSGYFTEAMEINFREAKKQG